MNWASLRNLARADAQRVARDTFLGWMAVVPLAMALALRCLAEPIRAATGDTADATRWTHIIDGAFSAIVLPLVMGTLLGFMLLDDKDTHTLTAIRATPLSLHAHLAWRATATAGCTIVSVALTHPIAGLDTTDTRGTLLIALAGAPLAGSFGLGLAATAANKIQGFALVKLALVALLLPCVGLTLAGTWRWATIWLPSWWPLMVHNAATRHAPAWALLAGDYAINIPIILAASHRLTTTT